LSSSISDVAARPSSTVESASSIGSWISAATVWSFRVSHVTPALGALVRHPHGGPIDVDKAAALRRPQYEPQRRVAERVAEQLLHGGGRERLPARSDRDLTEADRGEHVAADLAGENRERNRDDQEAARDPERRVQTEGGGIQELSDQEHDHARDEHGGQRRDRAAAQTARGPDLASSNMATPIAETANRIRTAVPSAAPMAAWPLRTCSAFGGQR